MSKFKETGFIAEKQNLKEKIIIWKIANFSTVTTEGDFDYYKSPTFKFEHGLWNMNIWRLKPMYPETLFLCLINENVRDYSVQYRFELKTMDKNTMFLDAGILKGEKMHEPPSDFFKLSDILQHASQVLPSDTLTVICTMKRLPEDYAPVRNSCFQNQISDESLCEDYKRVFRNGQNHDLILKICDKEFPVHRDILRIRSPAFESELSHNMIENNNIINIPDCDAHAMEQFLLYVYCGKIEAIDESIMLELYHAADKYGMTSLKEECCDFIKQSLSTTNVCEIIQTALTHKDCSLFDYARKYFYNNLPDVLNATEEELSLEFVESLKFLISRV